MSLHIESLISDLRARLQLSQERLASVLRVSVPTIQRWEKGKNQPDLRAKRLLADHLKKLGPEFQDLYDRHFGTENEMVLAASGLRNSRSKNRRPTAEDIPSGSTPSGMDVKEMEGLLWRAACSIRGEKDASKFKDYILPLVFIKRLSDVFEDELTRLSEEYDTAETARDIVALDHGLVRFYIPEEARWPVVSGRQSIDWPAEHRPRTLGEQVTIAVRAIAKANPTLQGVIDIRDFNETRNGEREIGDDALKRLINILSDPRCRLGLTDVEPDFLGRAYEYLLRKFAEDSGQSAGEFFTPTEVGFLMAHIMRPKPGETCHDYACGSAGLLIKLQIVARELDPTSKVPLKLSGQELQAESYAVAQMNAIIHDMDVELARGDKMINPKFRTADGKVLTHDI